MKEKYHLVYKTSTTPFFPGCLVGGAYSSDFSNLVDVTLPSRKVVTLIVNGTTSWFFDERLKESAEKMFEIIFTSPSFLREWKIKEKKTADELKAFTTFIPKHFFNEKRLNKYGEEQLDKLFTSIRDYSKVVDCPGFLFQVYLTEKFRAEIFTSINGSEEEKQNVFEFCISSYQKTNYERLLFAIAEVITGRKTSQEVTDEFYWVVHDYLGQIIDEEFVKKKIKEVKKDPAEFHLYLAGAEERIEKIAQMKKTLPSQLLKKVEIIQEILYYYNERKKEVLNQANIFIRRIMEEKFSGISITKLKKYYQLSPAEIIDVLKGGEIEKIEKRSLRYGYVFTHEIISSASEEYFSLLEDLPQDKIIKGTPASPGKIKGYVRIILNISHIYNFKEDEILVAPFTNVNYLPIMSKAKAILTETGGLTSHAAIVSRELKKSCIVGIKHLLLHLKDGDYIEVDADKGIVRIIE